MTIIFAVLLGAAWRRWFGSERPGWAFTGYRAMQVASGIGVLALVSGPSLLSLAISGAAVGFMTLPIWISRQPFLWLAKKCPWLPTTDHLDHPWKSMLQGAEPWAEVFQGMTVFGLAALAHSIIEEIAHG